MLIGMGLAVCLLAFALAAEGKFGPTDSDDLTILQALLAPQRLGWLLLGLPLLATAAALGGIAGLIAWDFRSWRRRS
jgi:hypothetical protein